MTHLPIKGLHTVGRAKTEQTVLSWPERAITIAFERMSQTYVKWNTDFKYVIEIRKSSTEMKPTYKPPNKFTSLRVVLVIPGKQNPVHLLATHQ